MTNRSLPADHRVVRHGPDWHLYGPDGYVGTYETAATAAAVANRESERIARSVIERRRSGIIGRMVASGAVDPACQTCARQLLSYEDPSSVMYPRHAGSPRCQSGSLASGGHRAHCTCNTCF